MERAAAIIGEIVRDVAGIGGAAAITYGAWLVYEPAAWIIGGTLAIGGAFLSARGR